MTLIGWKDCLAISGLTAFHAAMISVPPVYIRVDQNKDDAFCIIGTGGKSVPDDGIGDCVLDFARVAGSFGEWFGFHIALLLAILAVAGAVAFFALRRRLAAVAARARSGRFFGVPSTTPLVCLVLSGIYAVAPVAVAPLLSAVRCAFDGFATGRCAHFAYWALGAVGWGVAHALAMVISTLLAALLFFIAVGFRQALRRRRQSLR